MADPVLEASITAWAVTVPASMEDDASGLVWTASCTGVTIEQASVDSIRLVCFYDDADAHAEEIQRVAAELGTTAIRLQVPNPDWVQRFKETFTSFDVPPFRIVPEWIHEPVGPTSRDTTIRIRVDPGRAFGTGTHESTKLCLDALGGLAPSLKKSPRVLDLGCGTGILAIAAVKGLNARVVACDFDPLASSSARKHADMNEVSLEILLMDGCRGLLPNRFDLVFANLMAPFLISRVAEITAVGAPGCRFILAGLLAVEETDVRAAWPRDWKVTPSYRGEWASLTYERP